MERLILPSTCQNPKKTRKPLRQPKMQNRAVEEQMSSRKDSADFLVAGMRKFADDMLNKEEEQVIIECVEITPQIREIHSYVENKGREILGIVDGEYQKRFLLKDVYYFEALDEKVFAYTKEQVYEIRMRLYEVEKSFENQHFIRCSKSVVLNLMLLDSISPALNGRFFAHMKNGEKLIISRQYDPMVKKVIMGGNEDEA